MELTLLRSLFPDLEEPLLNDILKHGVIKEVEAGTILLKPGQTIRSTMLVMDGIVKLYREDEEGKEFFVYHLNAGQACSLSMVCATRHETSEVLAKAYTDAAVLSIPLSFMDEWMKKYPSWYRYVITQYRERFEELLKTVDAIAFTNMDERLASYLQKQADTLGPQIKMTHQEIATDLNSSREVISRLLKKMEAKGWVEVHRSSIEWLRQEA